MISFRSLLLLLSLGLTPGCHTRPLSGVEDGGPPSEGGGLQDNGLNTSDQSTPLPPPFTCNINWHCSPDASGGGSCQSEADMLENDCFEDESGKRICQSILERAGLPPGGVNWTCHLIFDRSLCEWPVQTVQWICTGRRAERTLLGGCGWECEELNLDQVRCSKPLMMEDEPPLGAPPCLPQAWCSGSPEDCVLCIKGSAYGGTRCEVVKLSDSGRLEPAACKVGQRRWCEDNNYDGWGIVDCDPQTQRWKTRFSSTGSEELACQTLSDGRRANTQCACYYPFFNPQCCERADCLVPEDLPGQICPPSPGALCNYCNPQRSECAEPGARCLISSNNEAFCGKACSLDEEESCPPGTHCLEIELLSGPTTQCVPFDLSCYF